MESQTQLQPQPHSDFVQTVTKYFALTKWVVGILILLVSAAAGLGARQQAALDKGDDLTRRLTEEEASLKELRREFYSMERNWSATDQHVQDLAQGLGVQLPNLRYSSQRP